MIIVIAILVSIIYYINTINYVLYYQINTIITISNKFMNMHFVNMDFIWFNMYLLAILC